MVRSRDDRLTGCEGPWEGGGLCGPGLAATAKIGVQRERVGGGWGEREREREVLQELLAVPLAPALIFRLLCRERHLLQGVVMASRLWAERSTCMVVGEEVVCCESRLHSR